MKKNRDKQPNKKTSTVLKSHNKTKQAEKKSKKYEKARKKKIKK